MNQQSVIVSSAYTLNSRVCQNQTDEGKKMDWWHTHPHTCSQCRLVIPQQGFQTVVAHRPRWLVHLLWPGKPVPHLVSDKLKSDAAVRPIDCCCSFPTVLGLTNQRQFSFFFETVSRARRSSLLQCLSEWNENLATSSVSELDSSFFIKFSSKHPLLYNLQLSLMNLL